MANYLDVLNKLNTQNKKKKKNDNSSYQGGILTNAVKNILNPISTQSKERIIGSLLGPIGGLVGETISENKKRATELAPVKKKQQNEAYEKLKDYKKKNGINLLNENSTKNKQDKEYQSLLKSAQNEIKNNQKLRNEQSVENIKFNKGLLGTLEKSTLATAGGFTKGVAGIESTVNKLLRQSSEDQSKYDFMNMLHQKAYDKASNKFEKTALDVSSSIGQMVPQMATGNSIGAFGVGFANYGGSAYNEAKKEGANEKQATLYGLVSGSTEMLMEKALGGFEKIYGKSMPKKFTDNIMNKLIKNKVVRQTLSGMKGEFTEEYLQEFLEPILKNVILEEKNGADFWNTMKDDIGEGLKQLGTQIFNKQNLIAGLEGALTSGLMETPRNISLDRKGIDVETGRTKNEQKVFESEVNERIKKAEQNGKKITEKEKTKIEKQVEHDIEKGYISTDRIESILGGETYNQYKKINDKKNSIQEQINELQQKSDNNELESLEEKKKLQDLKNQIKTIDDSSLKEKLTKEVNEIISNDYGLKESYNELSRKSQQFEKDLSNLKEGKLKDTYIKAINSGVLNNSRKTHDFVDMIAKISQEKGIDFNFTDNQRIKESGLGIDGKTINGYITSDGITINLNSTKALNRIVGHELTHTFEGTKLYTELQNNLREYLGETEYNNKINEYKNLYKNIKNANIENELTSDLVGEYLFTDEEFVRNLSTKNKNVFEKVFDEIKYLYKIATAGSKEARQLEKVKNTFEKIYNTKFKTNVNTDTKYSLIGETGIENIKEKNPESYQNVKKLLDFAKEMQKNNEDNNKIWQKTGWFIDKNNRWKFEISDKNMALKEDINIKPNKYYKLSELINHDLLFKVYPEIKNLNVRFKDFLKPNVNGSYSRVDDIISLNNNLINNKQNIEGTLIHEIQHKIQSIENFENGSNTKLSSLKYYKSLGEIEASNTRERFEQEKYKNYNLDYIAPLTVDKNARHKDLDMYLKDRSKTDKIKDKIFSKVGEKNVKSNQEVIEKNSSRDNDMVVGRIKELTNSSFFDDNILINSDGKKIDITNLEENSTMKMYHYNRKYNKNTITTYRGESESTGSGAAMYGLGLYTTLDRKYASQYGNVKVVDNSLLPDNPLIFKTQNDFQIWEQELARELGIRKKELYSQDYGVERYIKKMGYDGLMIGSGKDTDLISFTNKNLAKNEESSIKYSLSQTEENGLKKSNIMDEKLEQARKRYADVKVEKAIQRQSYKSMNIATKVAQEYLSFDNQQKRDFKEKLYLLANKTKEQLISDNSYSNVSEIINQYANKEYTFVDEQIKNIKNEIKETAINIPDEIKNQITDYSDFKKSSKLNIVKDGQNIDSVWQELNESYPYYFSNDITSEADMLYELADFMNKDIKVTEKYRIPDSMLKVATDKVYNKLIDNSLSELDIDNLQKTIEEQAEKRTRQVVRDEMLREMGITIDDIQQGNDINSIEIQRTDPIRLHEKIFGYKTGQKINDATINKTKHNEAEKTRWLNNERNELKELGIKARSKESALVQKYGEGKYINDKGEYVSYGDRELFRDVSDKETREKIKNAAEVIRNKYDSYIDQINEVLVDMGYNPMPKRKDYFRHFYEINDKLSQCGVPFNANDMNSEVLPTDINGLTDQFKPGKNWFASAMQRKGEKTTYDAITGIDGYLEGASNLIFHTADIQRYRALSSFIRENYGAEHGMENVDGLNEEEIIQRLSDIQNNKLSKYVAWLDEQANALAGKKGAIDRSIERFFGRRIYTALNTLKSQVGSNMTGFNVRSALTNFASAIQGASKTNKFAFLKGTLSTFQNIIHDDGMIEKSDFLTNRFGSDLLSSKIWQKVSNAGQILMSGSDYFTSNQIWRSKYFENLSKGMSESEAIKNADDFASRIMGDRIKGATAEIFNSKTLGFLTQFQLEVNNQWSSLIHDNKMDIESGNKSGATVVFQLGQLFAASYVFNNIMKSLTGSDVMFDPIDMIMDIFKPDEDDERNLEERFRDTLGKLVDQLPMASIFTGGRIPIQEAFNGVSTGLKYMTSQTNKYGQKYTIDDVKDDFIGSVAYWLLPTGYGQLRKTVKGLSMYSDKHPLPGSYTKSGNLRFSADDTVGQKIKAGLFGQYATKYASDYVDSGYKSINKNNIDEMKELDMNSTEYRKYRQGLSDAGKKKEEKLNYINNLDISDEKKNIMASNLMKKDIDMSEYNNYSSYKEFSYANKNPEKYSFLEQTGIDYNKYSEGGYVKNAVDWAYNNPNNYYMAQSVINGDVVKYKEIYDNINEIKGVVKADGTTLSDSRKAQVIKYVNSLNLSIPQKALLIKQEFPGIKQYDKQIVNYINNKNIDFMTKASMLRSLGFNSFDKQIIDYVKKNSSSTEEQWNTLRNLGFKFYSFRGQTYIKG